MGTGEACRSKVWPVWACGTRGWGRAKPAAAKCGTYGRVARGGEARAHADLRDGDGRSLPQQSVARVGVWHAGVRRARGGVARARVARQAMYRARCGEVLALGSGARVEYSWVVGWLGLAGLSARGWLGTGAGLVGMHAVGVTHQRSNNPQMTEGERAPGGEGRREGEVGQGRAAPARPFASAQPQPPRLSEPPCVVHTSISHSSMPPHAPFPLPHKRAPHLGGPSGIVHVHQPFVHAQQRAIDRRPRLRPTQPLGRLSALAGPAAAAFIIVVGLGVRAVLQQPQARLARQQVLLLLVLESREGGGASMGENTSSSS
eukprot:365860-Chlamydomonas_euryale.AAC.9